MGTEALEHMLALEPRSHVVGPNPVATLTRANQHIDHLRRKYGEGLVITVTVSAHLPARKMLHAKNPTE